MPICSHLQPMLVCMQGLKVLPIRMKSQQMSNLMQSREIVMFHRDWCKKAVVALKQGKPTVPYYVFVSGPGGVGKSHVIRLIHSDTLKLLRLSGTVEPDDY